MTLWGCQKNQKVDDHMAYANKEDRRHWNNIDICLSRVQNLDISQLNYIVFPLIYSFCFTIMAKIRDLRFMQSQQNQYAPFANINILCIQGRNFGLSNVLKNTYYQLTNKQSLKILCVVIHNHNKIQNISNNITIERFVFQLYVHIFLI